MCFVVPNDSRSFPHGTTACARPAAGVVASQLLPCRRVPRATNSKLSPVLDDHGGARIRLERVVRFERVGPKVLLVQPNLGFRADSDNTAERRAVRAPTAS